jgi:uncharacterized protein with NRDE domain
MCLVVIAHRAHPDLPLIVAGNRDEFHGRPASAASWWSDTPDILGGRDLEAGGTWLGVHRSGRFATVTNYRDADQPSQQLVSRGGLVTDFLQSDTDPFEIIDSIDGGRYAGFNLLGAADGRLVYRSNRGAGSRELEPGIYAVANATLDTPWPKVERIKAALGELILGDAVDVSALLDMLYDRTRSQVDAALENYADLPAERLQALSAPFVVMPEYGTRCSTAVLVDSSGQLTFAERRFNAAGEVTGQSDYSIDTPPVRTGETA